MKRTNGRRAGLLLLGGGLIALVNLIVLLGVAWNRSGEAEARLSLSERELGLPYLWQFNHDNSGLALQLRWRVLTDDPKQELFVSEQGNYTDVPWLDAAKLATLGFDVTPSSVPAPGGKRRSVTTRTVWLVLELDGPTHARALAAAHTWLQASEQALAQHPDDRDHQERAKAARQRWAKENGEYSRLFVIDAGRDADALRITWPDRNRYAIVSGRVRPAWQMTEPTQSESFAWRGRIEAVDITRLQVPLDLRSHFEPLLADPKSRDGAHYTVAVRYGRRREPWITAVR